MKISRFVAPVALALSALFAQGGAQAAALGHKAHNLVDLAVEAHRSAGFEQLYAGIGIKLHNWALRLSVAGAGQKAPADKDAGIGMARVGLAGIGL